MNELITITLNPKEFMTITIDHYMELVKKADSYDELMEILRNFQNKRLEGDMRNDRWILWRLWRGSSNRLFP